MKKTDIVTDKDGHGLQVGDVVEVQKVPMWWYGVIVDIDGRLASERIEVEGTHENKTEWVSPKDVVWRTKTEGVKKVAFNRGDSVRIVADYPADTIAGDLKARGVVGVVTDPSGYDPDYPERDFEGPPALMVDENEEWSEVDFGGTEIMVPNKHLEKVAMKRESTSSHADANGVELSPRDKVKMVGGEQTGVVMELDPEGRLVRVYYDGMDTSAWESSGNLEKTARLKPGAKLYRGNGSFPTHELVDVEDGTYRHYALKNLSTGEVEDGRYSEDDLSRMENSNQYRDGMKHKAESGQVPVYYCEACKNRIEMNPDLTVCPACEATIPEWAFEEAGMEKRADQQDDDLDAYATHLQSCFTCQQAHARMTSSVMNPDIESFYEKAGFCPEGLELRRKVDAYTQSVKHMGMKKKAEIEDSIGEPVAEGDKVIDVENNEEGAVLEISGTEAFIEWVSGRQEWTTGDMLVRAMKRTADEPAMTGKAEAVMGIGAYISATEAAKDASQKQFGYQTGMILKEEPFASQFLERVKQEVGSIAESDAEVLEWNNFHTELELLRENGLVKSASKKEALYFEDEIMDENFPEGPSSSATSTALSHSFQVGDVLHGSFGYDETHNYFAEVTGIIGSSTLLVRPISYEQVGAAEDMFSSRVRPVPGKYTGPEVRTRVGRSGIHAKVPVQHLNEMLSASKCNPSDTFYASSGFH